MEELIQKIVQKCIEINKNTEHNIFINYSGHVESLEINIFLNGWKAYKDPSMSMKVTLDEEAETGLKNILETLEKLEVK